MVYFIVETPYENCFEVFFKDELGYPNFYRMTELLAQDQYQNLVLLAAVDPHPTLIESLSKKASENGIKYLTFGEGLQTQFTFHTDGMIQTHPEFQSALNKAIHQFMNCA